MLKTNFVPNLDLQGPYEIALQSLETYYSFPNIDKGNNKIRVSIDGGTVWNDLTFAVGCYEYKHINKELQRQVEVILEIPFLLRSRYVKCKNSFLTW